MDLHPDGDQREAGRVLGRSGLRLVRGNLIMRRPAASAVLIVLAVLAAGCRDHARDVAVIEKTGSYHMDTCVKARMADTKTLSLEQARALGFKACPHCRPDLKIKSGVLPRKP